MKRILIIDDEPAVVQGLSEDIDWNALGISQIYEAHNGREARIILESERIDIIISDIRMPLMDGLSLAEIVIKKWPFCRLIVLSGYDLFSYAQKAVQCRVFRYLTKPAPYEEIVEAVSDALLDQAKQLKRLKSLTDAETNLEHILPLFQRKLFQGFIVNDDELSPQQIELLRENIPYISRETAICQMYIRSSFLALADLNEIKQSIMNVDPSKFKLFYLDLIQEGSYILLALWENTDIARIGLEQMETFSDLLFPSHDLLIFSPLHELKDAGDYYSSIMEKTAGNVQWGDERIVLSNAWDRLTIPPHQMVKDAKRFIEKNIAVGCPIQDVADSVKTHPGYLSKLFRETEGMNLQSYIISRRMELAARLLKVSGARVYDVAEKIGYNSPYHFSRIFKKIKGISPKDYQIHNI